MTAAGGDRGDNKARNDVIRGALRPAPAADRGDNTARCNCWETGVPHKAGALGCKFPAPAADRQTDEERPGPDIGPGTLAARLADWREEQAYLAARPAVADAVMADPGAAITEGVTEAKLREAVARWLWNLNWNGGRQEDDGNAFMEWDGDAELTQQALYRERADAVLALPEMRALLDAAAKDCGHPCIRCVGSREDPNFDIEAALGGEG